MNTDISELRASECEPECSATRAATSLRHVTVPKRGSSESTTVGTLGDASEVCPSRGKRLNRVLETWSGLRSASGLCAGTVSVPCRVAARESGDWPEQTNVLVDELSAELARVRSIGVLYSRKGGTIQRVPVGIRAAGDELLEQVEIRPSEGVISRSKQGHMRYAYPFVKSPVSCIRMVMYGYDIVV